MFTHAHTTAMKIYTSSPRRSSFGETGSYSSQAAVWELLGHAPCSLCSLDETAQHFTPAGNSRRPWQKQVRAHGGKCVLTPATHHAQAAGETTSMHQGGPHPSRALGKGGPDLETCPLPCSTR